MTYDPNLSQELTRKTMALVLAGGRGTRLKQLTDKRAKPAVYFGGKYRIIDFALSNCLNSGIRRIGVVTQYKSHSLLRHLQHGWNFLRAEINEFIDLMPAQQRLDDAAWYRGTADAVFQNLDIVRARKPEYVVILAGDHIYKMDYSRMLADHAESGAACTVSCIECSLEEAKAFGVMAVDENLKVTRFEEKPDNPSPIPDQPDRALASMGIYVFDAEFLYAELARDLADPDSEHDFGKNVIPRLVAAGQLHAHPFSRSCVGQADDAPPYWRDVGTIDAYWSANLDLTEITPALNLYDRNWSIWTYQRQLPAAKFVLNEHVTHSVFSSGCVVTGSRIRSSVLFSECRIHTDCRLNEAVLLPEVEVGRGARLERVVIDRGCHIPPGMVVGEDPEKDAKRFHRTENGVTLITRPMLAALAEAAERL